MTHKCYICGLMTRNLRAHLKINHKTASTGFTKSPASASATETALASAPLVSPQLRLSYHQRMKERRAKVRERRERYSSRRGTSGRITSNDSLNKSLLMLAEMIDEKETKTLGEEIISGLSEEVKMYRQGYVKENGLYIRKQYEHCPVCFLHLKLFKCENKLYESYQIVTHIGKCQTLKVKSELITDDSDISPETFLDSKDSSLSSNCSPMTSVYIKEEELSIKKELISEDEEGS